MHHLDTQGGAGTPGTTPSKFQLQEEVLAELAKHPSVNDQLVDNLSPVFPFATPSDISNINDTLYSTPQTLVQQVAYALSDRLFTYSPETFSLDDAVKAWSAASQHNARGKITTVDSMETRLGAANVLLGYIFSADSEPKKRVAQSIIASTATLTPMRAALDQLTMLYSMSSPFVAHIAAVDYEVGSSQLVSDYFTAMSVAQETGSGLVASFSAHEAQHMALFATLMATILPTLHIYDGVRLARESTKIVDILDQQGLQNVFSSIVSETAKNDGDKSFAVSRIMRSLNAELGTSYSPIEYEGHDDPVAVLVVFGSVEASLATQVASALTKLGVDVGVLAVRVYSPFPEELFIEALPKSVKRIVVLGQVFNEDAVVEPATQSPLFSDVVATVTMSDAWTLPPSIVDLKYARSHVWAPKSFAWIFEQMAHCTSVTLNIPDEETAIASFQLFRKEQSVQQFSFFDGDDAASAPAASVVAHVLSRHTDYVSFAAGYDNVANAGTLHAEIRTGEKPIDALYTIEKADVTFVGNLELLARIDVSRVTQKGGVIIVKTNIKQDEYEKRLSVQFRQGVARSKQELVLLDSSKIEDLSPAVENALVQLAFFRLGGIDISLDTLSTFNCDRAAVHQASSHIENVLFKVDIPKEWSTTEFGENEHILFSRPSFNSFSGNDAKHVQEPSGSLNSWTASAKLLAFKEAYAVRSDLRPDLTMKNYVVKVRENRRLTPTDYDRNIFHIEFDLGGTGLTYDIGEALGVHAHNGASDVEAFISFYGLKPDDLVEVPSREDPDVLEVRTVFQALQQNLDIFGRPPKRFYEALAEHAIEVEEKKALLAICSPDGAVEFKRRAEVDTVTYFDILEEHSSARPPFEELVKMVAPMKRREYSIASAQVVNPDSMHLMIVVVNWTDPKGRDRWGQATRYLSQLPIGAEVVVSVKPSVMKLPPSTDAPLIMAGLGTGLAPFRAFVQHRAHSLSLGHPIGPVLLYMGSRHRAQEYLYGEEWEAYQAAGIITLLGTAFSRDQKNKIYIQDRMRESMESICEAYFEKGGSFYLCGPTWPVPDVQGVLEEAAVKWGKEVGKGGRVDGGRVIEELKEAERYVLEVY